VKLLTTREKIEPRRGMPEIEGLGAKNNPPQRAWAESDGALLTVGNDGRGAALMEHEAEATREVRLQ